ncbi:hypothetical protein SDC9_144078 [bioreactor metagenome]|uniref:Uncharacterized protein n=1 Tax=bioreactor metagenome TaxID=1076179 RepID=A0A645E5Q8_9ZZZZ
MAALQRRTFSESYCRLAAAGSVLDVSRGRSNSFTSISSNVASSRLDASSNTHWPTWMPLRPSRIEPTTIPTFMLKPPCACRYSHSIAWTKHSRQNSPYATAQDRDSPRHRRQDRAQSRRTAGLCRQSHVHAMDMSARCVQIWLTFEHIGYPSLRRRERVRSIRPSLGGTGAGDTRPAGNSHS